MIGNQVHERYVSRISAAGHNGRIERIELLLEVADRSSARLVDDFERLARRLFPNFHPATIENYAQAAFRIRRGQRS